MSLKRSVKRGSMKGPLLVVLLLFIIGAAFAIKIFFKRPGEQAINMFPADAYLIITLDTTPSPKQTILFKRINDTIKSAGLNQMIDDLITSSGPNKSALKDLRQTLSSSFAFVMLNPHDSTSKSQRKPNLTAMPGRNPGGVPSFNPGTNPEHMVGLFQLTDTNIAHQYLDKNATKFSGPEFDYYKLKAGEGVATFLNGYLIIAQTTDDLAQIVSVSKGISPSVTTLAAYTDARSSLPNDANLMIFASPSAMNRISEETKKTSGLSAGKTTEWMAFGATLQDEGLVVDVRAPASKEMANLTAILNNMKPIDMTMIDRLPAGACGIASISQFSHYWSAVEETLYKDAKTKAEIETDIADFEKSMGISLKNDILPGLEGDIWIAGYLDSKTKATKGDILLAVTDNNNSAPEVLTEKVIKLLSQPGGDGKPPVTFDRSEKEGVKYIYLSSKDKNKIMGVLDQNVDPSASRFNDVIVSEVGVSSGGKSVTFRNPNLASPLNNSHSVKGSEIDDLTKTKLAASKSNSPFANKEPAIAIIGKTILIASSRTMLDKAVLACQGKSPSLATDQAFKTMVQGIQPSAQQVTMINLGGVLTALKPYYDDMNKGSGSKVSSNDIIDACGGPNAAIVASGSYKNGMYQGHFVMPMDVSKIIKLIGDNVPKPKKTIAIPGSE